MNPPPIRTFHSKLAWHDVPRVDPPKRSVPERIADFLEIYSLYDEAEVRAQASRCIQCPEALCVTGCPLANRIPEWLGLAAEGKFSEAGALAATTSNMPEICSRICPHERLCEGACILNARADPVAIGAVEKFISEYALIRGQTELPLAPPNGHRVAVVGSGPGGLACADELALRGYAVTVFESERLAGGLLVNGIPAFKLEKEIVERRLQILRRRGVEFRLGVKVGRDISMQELRGEYAAVFLAIGAQEPKPLDVPGADLAGVYDALPFLVQKNAFGPSPLPPIEVEGKCVAVLGGGDTAMDCLRTALRCGARQAICLYRRDLVNMPGSRTEYWNALEEGAQFSFLTNPVAIQGDPDAKVTHVRCVRMELGEPDVSGRQKPRPVRGSDFLVPADVVLAAYGFEPPPLPADDGFPRIEVQDWGAVVVDSSQTTNAPGVFAGGDLARGPSLVVHAVRDGRRAAEAIDCYIKQSSKG